MCNRKPNYVGLALVISYLIVQFGLLSCAQDSKVGTGEEINSFLMNFGDASWEKRCDAFYHLLGYESYAKWDGRTDLIPSKLARVFSAHPDRENELKLALIKLLSKENATVEAQN